MRIVTAREQFVMLSPWLKIAGDPTLPLGIPDSHPLRSTAGWC